MYKNGISLLLPTQNASATVLMCIESFLPFADEILIVDNGSTDRTREIARQAESTYDKVRFFDRPDISDLSENRQYAFSKSRYRWVARLDSDYVAYQDGTHCIRRFRDQLLRTKWHGLRPPSFSIRTLNLYQGFRYRAPMKGEPGFTEATLAPLFAKQKARFIHRFPGMRFERNGRYEVVRWQRHLNNAHCDTKIPLVAHDTTREPLDYLLRKYRQPWRQEGRFNEFPTVLDYATVMISRDYGTSNIEEAARIHYRTRIEKYFVKYDPDAFEALPSIVPGFADRNCAG